MKSICIIAIVLCFALRFTLCISADNFACPARMFLCKNFNASGSTGTLDFIVDNGGGNPSVTPVNGYHLGVEVENQFQNNTSYVFVITINGNNNDIWYSDYYNILQLHSGNVTQLYNTNDSNNYFERATFQTTGLHDSTISYIITFNTNGDELAYTYDRLYFAWVTKLTGTSNYTYRFQSITAYATYDPYGATLNDIRQEIQNVINSNTTNNTTINNKLDQVISNQNNSNQSIEQALEDIISNQEAQNQYWEQIINYGNSYDQVDQNLVNNLGNAEDQLSNAEDAIENKSKSLVNKVASQWSDNKGVATSFLASITPAASGVGTVTNIFFDVIPIEIKNAVITIMLIVFIGWLLGRVEG